MPNVMLTPDFIKTELLCPEDKTKIEYCDLQVRGMYVTVSGDFQGSCRVNHSRSLLFLPAIDVMFRVEPDRRHQRPVPGLS